MTKKSFKDMIREAGKDAAEQAKGKTQRREEDATRPQIAVQGTQQGLTEPPRRGSGDSTRQMTPVDKELALSQDRATAMKDKRGKGKWETSPTMQMEPLTEQALLEKVKALGSADVKAAPSPIPDLLDDILKGSNTEEAEEIAVSVDIEELDRPLGGAFAEPPTVLKGAMTEREAAKVAEPPTVLKPTMTEREAAKVAEPPTVLKPTMTEREAATVAPTAPEKGASVDDSVLREIEQDVFSAESEAEGPAVAEESQSVALEESYQLLTEKVNETKRETGARGPMTTEGKRGLGYYFSELFLGATSVAAAAVAVAGAESLSVKVGIVLVGYMAFSGTVAMLSFISKRRARRQEDNVSRGGNDEC